ncbi:3-hydroxy-3-methylglutaryl CoA synthase [Bacillus ectoiniformans]|uniref:OB-fold domain-containing protein n=1 Tax=Bacillus ectoiniformans TaxID=1494429 RepID=UPI00195C33B5|nr:OB-fold domain-containing protein [Bacillus ectoiniformans]MBM7647717.1 3-hydroxy-3-methylglutaryl CoA synthase [Bacillus ectoiniformans]
MIGIKTYGVHIPLFRLSSKEAAGFYGKKATSSEKAVAGFDEDSLSMAVNASLKAVKSSVESIGLIQWATTTPAYFEKSGAVTMAQVLNMKDSVRTNISGGSMRASTESFLLAKNFAEAERKDALVAFSDTRAGKGNSLIEAESGDGAVSFVIGEGEEVLAELVGSVSYSDEQLTQWRSVNHPFTEAWEDRFQQTVFLERIEHTVTRLLNEHKLEPNDIHHVVIAGPTMRMQTLAAKTLKLSSEQLTGQAAQTMIGHTGVAHPFMMFASCLENAASNEWILVVNEGDGCDALLFKTTKELDKMTAAPVKEALSEKRLISYSDYVNWKQLLPIEEGRRPQQPRLSAPAYRRANDQSLPFVGSKCLSCETPYLPAQRVCITCHSLDGMEPYSFRGKRGYIATFTIDYLAFSKASPTILCVIDFEGGGRILAELADADQEKVEIGSEVTWSFRRMYERDGVQNYYWKAILKRGQGHV